MKKLKNRLHVYIECNHHQDLCKLVEMEGKLQALTKGANWPGPTMGKENLEDQH